MTGNLRWFYTKGSAFARHFPAKKTLEDQWALSKTPLNHLEPIEFGLFNSLYTTMCTCNGCFRLGCKAFAPLASGIVHFPRVICSSKKGLHLTFCNGAWGTLLDCLRWSHEMCLAWVHNRLLHIVHACRQFPLEAIICNKLKTCWLDCRLVEYRKLGSLKELD